MLSRFRNVVCWYVAAVYFVLQYGKFGLVGIFGMRDAGSQKPEARSQYRLISVLKIWKMRTGKCTAVL